MFCGVRDMAGDAVILSTPVETCDTKFICSLRFDKGLSGQTRGSFPATHGAHKNPARLEEKPDRINSAPLLGGNSGAGGALERVGRGDAGEILVIHRIAVARTET